MRIRYEWRWSRLGILLSVVFGVSIISVRIIVLDRSCIDRVENEAELTACTAVHPFGDASQHCSRSRPGADHHDSPVYLGRENNRVRHEKYGRTVDEDEIIPPAQKGKKIDRKSTRLNSSHLVISYAVFCLK